MGTAALIFQDRQAFADGAILTIRIWLLPSPVPPSRHRYKYSLFYGFPGSRLVGYDNERGKGDHKHLETAEVPYTFVSIAQLLNDFRADVERIRGERI